MLVRVVVVGASQLGVESMAVNTVPSSRYADLLGLVEQWRAEIKDRAGSGCGCYGKSTMQRKCADQLAGLLREIGREQEVQKGKKKIMRELGSRESVVSLLLPRCRTR